MAQQSSLIQLAKDAEDVASGLVPFRDTLPRNASRITATISVLFALSSILHEIDNVGGDIRFSSSFYNVQDDLNLLFPTFQRTLDAAFDMFARSRERPYQTVWNELGHKMESDEGISLLDRLQVYHDFLTAQADILQGRRAQNLHGLRKELVSLWDAQELAILRAERLSLDTSAATTPRPRQDRPRPARLVTPASPTSASESWSDYLNTGRPPPRAPNPPNGMPNSPTFTNSSSHTLSSSQTSYSSDRFSPVDSPQYIHWAQDIFDGKHPITRFGRNYQLNEQSICQGSSDASAIQHLARDGFVRALEIPFDQERFILRLYFRPADSRARILLTAKDSYPGDLHYCTPLTNLKVIRKASCLQLCRARGQENYSLWARLNFHLYERMVLFYCTFVAMKRQDKRPVPHEDLLEDFELEQVEYGEVEEFGGKVMHGNLRHALRLYKDVASGVIRVEASALRGPMKDVPLWTAFVTKYADDPAWAEFDGEGVVSLAAIKPHPYIFLAGYEPPKNEIGQYILQFITDQDAREFVETWTRLCRTS